jgi:hypothetical protein
LHRRAGLFEVIGYVLFAAWIVALLALAYSKIDLFGGWDTPQDNAAEQQLTVGCLNALLTLQAAEALLLLLQRGKRGTGTSLAAATLLLAVCTSGLRTPNGATPAPAVTPTGCHSRSGGTNTCPGG